MHHPNSFLLLALYLAILILLYTLIFSQRNKGFMKFVKTVLVPLTIVGGWVLYYIGYCRCEPETMLTNGLLALFSTARLFILGNDLIEIHRCVESDHVFLLWFSIMGTSAAFISASILLQLFGKKLISRIKLWMNKSEEVFVFFGINSAALTLAKDILQRDKKRLVIFIQKEGLNEDISLYHDAEEAGAFIINSESVIENIMLEKEESIVHASLEAEAHDHPKGSDYKILSHSVLIGKLLNRPAHLFFLSEKEELNISRARKVLNELKTFLFQKPITLHVRINSAELEELFYQSLASEAKKVKINLINLSEIASRQLVISHNPVDWIEKDTESAIAKSDFRVMVVGFDNTGFSVLKKLIEYGQFEGSEFQAIVTDKNLAVKKGRIEACFQGLIANYQIQFVETEPGSRDFFDLIKQHQNQLDFVVIAHGSDEQNIRLATDLQQYLIKTATKQIKIIAQVRDNDNYNLLFDTSKQVSISVFGREKDIFTEKIVVQQHLEKTAKRIHEYYNSKLAAGRKRQSWDELSLIKQLSNISATNHISTKLVLAGLTVEDVRKFTTAKEFEDFLGPKRMKNLAKTEHLRWNALHYANGWNTWPLTEIPPDSATNKDEERKLHACLVSWDGLDPVIRWFKEDYYAYDIENVVNIFDLIKNGAYTNDILMIEYFTSYTVPAKIEIP